MQRRLEGRSAIAPRTGGQRKYSLLFVQTAKDGVKERVTPDPIRRDEKGLAWLFGARDAPRDLGAIDFAHAQDQCIERGLTATAQWYGGSAVR